MFSNVERNHQYYKRIPSIRSRVYTTMGDIISIGEVIHNTCGFPLKDASTLYIDFCIVATSKGVQ